MPDEALPVPHDYVEAPAVATSILDSTKKALGLTSEYDVFDTDLVMHINSVFFTLSQLGVGPAGGFSITGADETWESFLGEDTRLNAVKSYMYLKVRLLFDPPATSFTISAMEKMASEWEWRLNVDVENRAYGSALLSPPVS